MASLRNPDGLCDYGKSHTNVHVHPRSVTREPTCPESHPSSLVAPFCAFGLTRVFPRPPRASGALRPARRSAARADSRPAQGSSPCVRDGIRRLRSRPQGGGAHGPAAAPEAHQERQVPRDAREAHAQQRAGARGGEVPQGTPRSRDGLDARVPSCFARTARPRPESTPRSTRSARDLGPKETEKRRLQVSAGLHFRTHPVDTSSRLFLRARQKKSRD